MLPSFGEPLDKRVWFGSGLIFGDGEDGFLPNPLKQLKHCGDVVARLLLAFYAGHDLDRWYGIPPHGFSWNYYKLYETTYGQFRVLRGESNSMIGDHGLFDRVDYDRTNADACFTAIKALLSAGFLYEMVVLQKV